MPVWALLAAAAALTYLLDQLTKVWALRALPDHSIDLVAGWLVLRLSHNPGAALSMGTSITWVFTILALAVSVGIAVLARRIVSRTWALTLGLLLGGALGNLTDRIVRPPGPGRGAVVDFISYGSWFIGNVADIAIVGAMILMMIIALRGVPLTAAEGTVPGVEETGQAAVVDQPAAADISTDGPRREEPLEAEPDLMTEALAPPSLAQATVDDLEAVAESPAEDNAAAGLSQAMRSQE